MLRDPKLFRKHKCFFFVRFNESPLQWHSLLTIFFFFWSSYSLTTLILKVFYSKGQRESSETCNRFLIKHVKRSKTDLGFPTMVKKRSRQAPVAKSEQRFTFFGDHSRCNKGSYCVLTVTWLI